ncbi:hypothetical protein N2152v2_006277 [Parachlorella kessleri]
MPGLLPVGLGPEQQLLRAAPQLLNACKHLRGFSAAAEPARVEEVKRVQAEQPAPPAQEGTPAGAAAQATPPAPLNFSDPKEAFQAKSTADIVRSLLVFKACGIKPLVRHADTLLRLSKRVLGSTLTNAVLGPTFYKQFVAGADAQSIQPTLAHLRRSGIRAILDYAAEDDVQEEPGHKKQQQQQGKQQDPLVVQVREPTTGVVVRTYSYEGEELCDKRMGVFRKSIEAAAMAEGQGFAAIKMTALGLPTLLERVSNSILAISGLFREFDADGNGVVTKEEFEQVYRELFVDGSSERVAEIFEHMDVDNDGKIDWISWTKRVTAFDTQAIAKRCRSEGPFSRAALNDEEEQLLRNMMRRVETLADIAAEGKVRLMIDAEHTYFQPAIDNTTIMLQEKYNKEEPVIFNTYQCYLKDSHERLLVDLERAKREGYRFGAKLVRGAYMVLERQRAKERGYPSPIHDTKGDTDASFDRNAAEVIRRVRGEGAEVMIATHSQESIEKAVALMGELGLPPSSGVYFGQLLGMADHLSFTLGQNGYGAYKYVPFGAVDEVLPYLVRRAQENSDMLGGVGAEMGMMRAELKRRLLGGK